MSFTRLLYLLLLFVVAWCGYYLLSAEQSDQIQVAPNLELPMFSGSGLENTTYAEDGVRSYVIRSSSLDHYAKSGDTIFEKPELMVYREGSVIEWKVTAKRAVLDEDQVLTLYDKVLMQNLLPEASFDTMATDKMVINLNNRDFKAEQQVLLVGPQFETTGGAMQGNLKLHTATLSEQVQGRYETITP
ncbi:LPS export ABC transporter periplasmic protein LptC [Vibrio rotiferianus]|jgi:lipopolysaccharide export system protein LptC|nr:LPS export ABC transporter periplasmic protein LptC [Vibrio rotiferianus]ASI95375.1 LPS export ABC transporter periplasmic protein LptC [Vibrio rotiferianus]NOH68470.1 LPS export ABC transporter periplasmic protein LptC [Vibrio rotiferianus]TMX36462.1 LPS export ABC transporter periplasmic protein LptC [Vibrio rotiferianus]TMX47268.1 LPS export ABC transporter periplasmic protein LptC [Vibrio rotiferianus]TMX62966.1 LPS export ABC transporter periplasmic protein LptC [Vibrio rotiferianus]